jgi:hypothetical protein
MKLVAIFGSKAVGEKATSAVFSPKFVFRDKFLSDWVLQSMAGVKVAYR